MIYEHYRRTISARGATRTEAYAALTRGYGRWWTATDDTFEAVGDRIRFAFPPNVSYWIFEATRLIPNQQVELTCVDALHKIVDKPHASETEWLGSRLIFSIDSDEEEIRIHLEHEGLMPELDCFEVCEAGWNHFFVDSLKRYLETGVGKPHQLEQSA